MSQLNLFGESFMKLPSIPNINNTLLFIQTKNYFPISSGVSLDHNVSSHSSLILDDSQNSLELELHHANHETIASASTIKKKKTGCTCKKTKCLKMYCECFSSGKLCGEECSCCGCSNGESHLELIQKAKDSIKQKFMSSSKYSQEKGCNCKKSQCQKKYCECFNLGVACTEACRCEDCENHEQHERHSPQKLKEEVNPEVFLL